VVDACEFHGVTDESVEKRWLLAESLGVPDSMCACCLGPCLVGRDFCTKCEVLTPVQVRYLELSAEQVMESQSEQVLPTPTPTPSPVPTAVRTPLVTRAATQVPEPCRTSTPGQGSSTEVQPRNAIHVQPTASPVRTTPDSLSAEQVAG